MRTSEGVPRRTRWQVADVRRPLISAGRIVEAGNEIHHKKDESFIWNVKKQQKTPIRKVNGVFVMDIFVKVATTYGDDMEVDTLCAIGGAKRPGFTRQAQ